MSVKKLALLIATTSAMGAGAVPSAHAGAGKAEGGPIIGDCGPCDGVFNRSAVAERRLVVLNLTVPALDRPQRPARPR